MVIKQGVWKSVLNLLHFVWSTARSSLPEVFWCHWLLGSRRNNTKPIGVHHTKPFQAQETLLC